MVHYTVRELTLGMVCRELLRMLSKIKSLSMMGMKKQAEKIGMHIKYCAYFFMISGVIGLIQSVYCYTSSRKWAKFIVDNKKLPWGHHKHHEEYQQDFSEPSEPQYLSRDEFLLFDIFKSIGTLSFMIFGIVLAVGCKSKKIVKFKSLWCAKWLIRKVIFSFFVFIFVYFISKQQGHSFKEIFMRIADEQTKSYMAEKEKTKFGMCPVMLVFLIVKAFNIYKLKSYQHSLEKIKLLEEHKKEQDKKDKIIEAVHQMHQ